MEFVNVNGVWKNTGKSQSRVNVDGRWRALKQKFVNVSGVWLSVFEDSDTPTTTTHDVTIGNLIDNTFQLEHYGYVRSSYGAISPSIITERCMVMEFIETHHRKTNKKTTTLVFGGANLNKLDGKIMRVTLNNKSTITPVMIFKDAKVKVEWPWSPFDMSSLRKGAVYRAAFDVL